MSPEQPPGLKWVYLTDRALDAFKHLVTCIAFIVIAYFVTDASKVLAGQETIAEFVLAVLLPVNFRAWSCYAVILIALGFGFWQQRLRKRAIAEMAGRIVYLEGEADPKRSSSQLTSTGDTRPEDR